MAAGKIFRLRMARGRRSLEEPDVQPQRTQHGRGVEVAG
jgi:hypothetical protein